MHASYSWTPEHIVLSRDASKLFADVIIPGRILKNNWFVDMYDRISGKERVEQPKTENSKKLLKSQSSARLGYHGKERKFEEQRGPPRVKFENIGVLVENTNTASAADVGFCF